MENTCTLKLDCARSPAEIEACLRDLRHAQLSAWIRAQVILGELNQVTDADTLRILEDRWAAIGIGLRALERHEAILIRRLPEAPPKPAAPNQHGRRERTDK